LKWWEINPEKWSSDVRSMKDCYPNFTWSAELRNGYEVRCWRGIIQPLPSGSDAEKIIADLKNDRIVEVSINGIVIHSQKCEHPHDLPPELSELSSMDTSFEVEVLQWEPPIRPTSKSINPPITHELYPDHPHIFHDKSTLCPYLPKEIGWKWSKLKISDYIDWISIFLVKHIVWLKTRERYGFGNGIWIGSAVEHSPEFLFRTHSRGDECWCSSGKPHYKCHRKFDLDRIKANKTLKKFY